MQPCNPAKKRRLAEERAAEAGHEHSCIVLLEQWDAEGLEPSKAGNALQGAASAGQPDTLNVFLAYIWDRVRCERQCAKLLMPCKQQSKQASAAAARCCGASSSTR
mmetsp:Transcript_35975/g.90863  ORF Transcript_35975/g.90863 Transcript_35975/m.90863 type:complete len:106 (-) Transcript_35975:1002-1319(-)